MSQEAHFGPGLFGFLAELRINNDRGWFQDNNGRYEADVRDPMLAFIADFAPRLREVSRHLVADPRPSGGSMFRIYRDVRFSKDKSPYKTQVAAHFRHNVGREVHGPGFYIHLEPEEIFAGAGMWHPDRDTLGRVRGVMAANPDRWRRSISSRQFKAEFTLGGESLKRPPEGYDADHPLIEDLKRKDYVASRTFTQEEACAPDFIDRYADACRASAPFMKFLTEAVGLPW